MSCSWSYHIILLLILVAEKVLLLLVISLTGNIPRNYFAHCIKCWSVHKSGRVSCSNDHDMYCFYFMLNTSLCMITVERWVVLGSVTRYDELSRVIPFLWYQHNWSASTYSTERNVVRLYPNPTVYMETAFLTIIMCNMTTFKSLYVNE